jgi:hypothetical protein
LFIDKNKGVIMGRNCLFDVDKYLAVTPYEDVVTVNEALMPGSGGNRGRYTPTAVSPDKSCVYLSQFELYVQIDDLEQFSILLSLLRDKLKSAIKRLINGNECYVENVFFLERDYQLVWGVLNENNALTVDCECPEDFFKKMWSEK